MKYVLVVGDGMADYPVPELGGKTPLQVARKPNMDCIAAKSRRSGLLKTVPDGFNPGFGHGDSLAARVRPKTVHRGTRRVGSRG